VRSSIVGFALVLAAFPLPLFARQKSKPVSLNPTQIEGRRIFDQHCGVCHLPFMGAKSGRNAVALNEDVVVGHEKAMAGIIRNGVPEMMPGFKYTLTDSQINAIVDYLKTVPKQTGEPTSHGKGPNAID